MKFKTTNILHVCHSLIKKKDYRDISKVIYGHIPFFSATLLGSCNNYVMAQVFDAWKIKRR